MLVLVTLILLTCCPFQLSTETCMCGIPDYDYKVRPTTPSPFMRLHRQNDYPFVSMWLVQ